MKRNLLLVYIFFGVSIIIILVLFFLYSYQFQQLVQSNKEAKRTNNVIKEIQDIQSTLIEVENREKGFLLNKKDTIKTFEILNEHSKKITGLINNLTFLLSDSKSQQQKIIKLKDDISKRFKVLDESMYEALENNKKTFEVYEIKEAAIMADFNRLIVTMENEEFDRLKKLEAKNEHSASVAPSYVELILSLTIVFQAISFSLMVIEFKRRKKYERDLELKITELNSSKSELEQITFVASHDLKEPLRKIRTFNDRLVKKHINNLDEDAISHFDKIDQSARRMQELIDDLVNYTSLLRSEELSEKVNLQAIIKQVKQQLAEQIKCKEATITMDHLSIINGYAQQLELLFAHLVQNALKYSKPGVPAVIKITAARVTKDNQDEKEATVGNNAYLQISVRDNGIGFDNGFAGKIFLIFQRLHVQHTDISGKGIGLAICKRIMLNHHGSIDAHGEEGNGATFNLYFPLN